MKHPHSELIKAMLADSNLKAEIVIGDIVNEVSISHIAGDMKGQYKYRIKKDEYQVFRDALEEGKELEYFFNGEWYFHSGLPKEKWIFNSPAENYRIHDEYRHLKDARDAGKAIAFLNSLNVWTTEKELGRTFVFNEPVEKYKIVEDDVTKDFYMHFGEKIGYCNLSVTKSGLTGEISVEVVK